LAHLVSLCHLLAPCLPPVLAAVSFRSTCHVDKSLAFPSTVVLVRHVVQAQRAGLSKRMGAPLVRLGLYLLVLALLPVTCVR
jgi:hypothetical protein